MLGLIRRHLASNIVGYLALAIATSGTAYAASITGADVVNDSLTGLDVRESTLKQVPKSLLSGKKVSYRVTRATTGTYAPVKIIDFRGLEVRVSCANQFAFLTVEVRSTIPGGKLDFSVIDGDLGSDGFGVAGSATIGGQDLQSGTWVPIHPQATNRRGIYDVLVSFPDRIVTAHFVGRMIAVGGYVCSVNGIVSGV
jgi:hypothetical protein